MFHVLKQSLILISLAGAAHAQAENSLQCYALHEPLAECFAQVGSCTYKKTTCSVGGRLYSRPEARCLADNYYKADCRKPEALEE